MVKSISQLFASGLVCMAVLFSGQALAASNDAKQLYDHCMEQAKRLNIKSNDMGSFIKTCTGPARTKMPRVTPVAKHENELKQLQRSSR